MRVNSISMRSGDGELAIGVGPQAHIDGEVYAANEAFLEAVADDSFENMPVGVALPIGKLHRANVFQASTSTPVRGETLRKGQAWNMLPPFSHRRALCASFVKQPFSR